ncbi:hypothetical protein [Klebsiella pneumoniae]
MILSFWKESRSSWEVLQKGMMLYFVGRIRNNKWQGTDGKMRSNKEIVIDNNGEMQMLPGAGPRNTSAEGQGGIENHDEPPFPDMNDYPQ